MAGDLDAVERALVRAGLQAGTVVLDEGREPTAGVRVVMPGIDACAVVRVAPVRRLRDGGWARSSAPDDHEAEPGYVVGFHERPFRTRGHGYQDAAEVVATLHVDEIVATIVGWARWETDWSVTPIVEPARKRLLRLTRLAASRRELADVPVQVRPDPVAEAMLTPDQLTAARHAVQELHPRAVAWNFPRDRVGRNLATGTQVGLVQCAPPTHPSGKGIWWTAVGPRPRSAPGITIELRRLYAGGQAHRWDDVPEFWRTSPGRGRTPEQLWGIADDEDAVRATIERLLAGETADGLSRWGIDLDDGTSRLLQGRPVGFELRRWTDGWVKRATDLLASSAPWLWQRAVEARPRPHRLAGLGGFNPNRRPGLFLGTSRGRTRLSFDPSASPLVLPRHQWERHPDLDLVLAGLLDRDELPYAARAIP